MTRCFTLSLYHLVTLSCLTLAFSPATAQDYRIDLDGQVDKSKFPEITFRFRIVDTVGNAVRHLPHQEIVVREDGKEVYREAQRLQTDPVMVVLVFDTSGSMWFPSDPRQTRQLPSEQPGKLPFRTKMEDAKQAAERFLLRLDSQTPCGLVLFHHQPWLVQPVNTSRERLLQDVKSVEVNHAGGTAINDALDRALELLYPDPTRQRIIVLMTDGREESPSKRTLDQVIQSARENRIHIYPIGLGEAVPIKTEDSREIPADLDEGSLKRLADETGGQYYHVREADKLSHVFERVAGQLQESYSVTFHSRRDFHDGTSRGIDIEFGKLAVGKLGYMTHGLITPMRDHGVYLGLLAVLGLLLAAPALLRRRKAAS